MPIEFICLICAVVLGLAQLMLAHAAAVRQRGMEWNAGNREGPELPLKGPALRLALAFENFKETFPFFAVALMMVMFSGQMGVLSTWGALLYLGARLVYVPVYAAGILYLRSGVWFVSMLGIALVIAALFF